MKKILLFTSIYIALLLYFLFQGGRTSMMLLVIASIVGLYLLVFNWSGKKLVTAQRLLNNVEGDQGSFVYTAGQSVEGKLSVDINLLIPPPFMQIEERLLRHDGTILSFAGFITTGFTGVTKFRYRFENMPRGLYSFEPIACTSYDAFGILKRNQKFAYNTEIKVLPKPLSQEQWQHLFKGYTGNHAFVSYNRFSKESNQQAGIREYHYGDKITKIHWNATARTGEWKSKDFEKESVPRTIILLDCYNKNTVVNGINPNFELAVSTATSLFEFGMKQQTPFGIISNSDEVFVSLAQHGQTHYSNVMNHLTIVSQSNHVPMSLFLKQLTLEKSFVGNLFIVTSDIKEKMLSSFQVLKRRGYEPYLFYVPDEAETKEQRLAQLNVFMMQGFFVFEVPAYAIPSTSVVSGGAVG